MNPEVTAAIIAGSVGIVTLIATVIVQIVGFRSTKANTERQITAAEKNTADTLEQQRNQLDKTLEAQSDQLDRTLTEQRTRTLNERFATAAEQLGSDKPAVRLAGVYAMTGLADDWEENRQTCVDVLCAYLRMPYEPDPGQDAPEPQQLAFQANREVRHTVIRVITAHLRKGAAVSWQGLNFDFTGAVFDGGDFSLAHFSGGDVIFMDATFSGGVVNFISTVFESEESPEGAFSGVASFVRARFTGGMTTFSRSKFASLMLFGSAEFSGGHVFFGNMEFLKGEVVFSGAEFSGANVQFDGAEFSGARVYFRSAFSGGQVDFRRAKFSGGLVSFESAGFSGAQVSFDQAEFSGGEVDFSDADDWAVPPAFPWTDTPPQGVRLPTKDQSEA